MFIPKEDRATAAEKFRTISLLNVEKNNIYFAMKDVRLLNFTLQNKYIDTSVQKGGIPKVSRCLEHTDILPHLIREAKERKKTLDLVVTWLDITSAYGSIPSSLILATLHRAHVTEDVCELVMSYYSDVKIRLITTKFTTKWKQHEKKATTGYTISVILFDLTMTILVLSFKGGTKNRQKIDTG